MYLGGKTKMPAALTDAAIRRLRPRTDRRPRFVRDGGARSLYLIVAASGSKTFGMRFRRPSGRVGKIVLGPFDLSGRELAGEPAIGQPLSLAAARALAARVHRDRALGVDAVGDHKARRVRARLTIDATFGALVRRFVAEHGRLRQNWRRQANVLGLRYGGDFNCTTVIQLNEPTVIPDGLVDRWQNRPAADVTPDDVHAIVDEARRIGTPGMVARVEGASEARAREMFAAIRVLFNWLARERIVKVNPVAVLSPPRPGRARDRVLSAAEVIRFWRAAEGAGMFGVVAQLLLVTGCRLSEVSGMRWSELADDGATVTIPTTRSKNRRAHVVPLPPLARRIIAGQRRLDGTDLIFTANRRTPIAGWGRAKRALDAAVGANEPWTLHDLRRTAATNLGDLGVRSDVVEAILNHSRPGIAAIYNRSELLGERRAALELWARRIEAIVGDPGVGAEVETVFPPVIDGQRPERGATIPPVAPMVGRPG
jgi:integrase